eukprot:CAMPEP_0201241968 /NCGR_PEP_ID=MMETSP0852-20130820/35943_1 /ASSEMBLY_ACC=CAM_ASM_000632 /TAXON_ID=183588 /ORGANISM="Pseudo-nitzschia fraudulenta, Strain WWA7" /LENGTH=35 /DNA_ID= /DNA_START= /DNA_END= /DNA_ORIENTATION=
MYKQRQVTRSVLPALAPSKRAEGGFAAATGRAVGT